MRHMPSTAKVSTVKEKSTSLKGSHKVLYGGKALTNDSKRTSNADRSTVMSASNSYSLLRSQPMKVITNGTRLAGTLDI